MKRMTEHKNHGIGAAFLPLVLMIAGCGSVGVLAEQPVFAEHSEGELHIRVLVPREVRVGESIHVEVWLVNVIEQDILLREMLGRPFWFEYKHVSEGHNATDNILFPRGPNRGVISYHRLKGGGAQIKDGRIIRWRDVGSWLYEEDLGPFDKAGEVHLRIHTDDVQYFIMGEGIDKTDGFDKTHIIRVVERKIDTNAEAE